MEFLALALYRRQTVGRYSKVKGHEFERKVAKILSQWWGEENSFVRTPGSGAYSKYVGDPLIKQKFKGDLITPLEFPYYVSIKKVKEVYLEQLFSSKSLLSQWWKEAVESSQRLNLLPMLIFSRNYSDIFVMFKPAKSISLECYFTFVPADALITTMDEFIKLKKEEVC